MNCYSYGANCHLLFHFWLQGKGCGSTACEGVHPTKWAPGSGQKGFPRLVRDHWMWLLQVSLYLVWKVQLLCFQGDRFQNDLGDEMPRDLQKWYEFEQQERQLHVDRMWASGPAGWTWTDLEVEHVFPYALNSLHVLLFRTGWVLNLKVKTCK